MHGSTTVVPARPLPGTENNKHAEEERPEVQPNATAPQPIASWNYTITGGDGKPYTGTILGRSPYNNGKTTTNIPTLLIPLVITITDSSGTVVYDPTAQDVCVPFHTPVDIIQKSPLLTNTKWKMNGVDMGSTQYNDASQRAQFWSLVGGTPYHLILQATTLPSQALSFGTGGTSGPGSNFSTKQTVTACESVGVVNINDMNNAIQALITGSGALASMVNIGTFPLFLTKNVVMASTGTNLFTNCCTLGFHSAFNVGQSLLVYGPFNIDTAGEFGPGYTSTMAHEIGEAFNDPGTNNATPSWGGLGQVVGTCQANFEVGDALSPGYGTPTTPYMATTNGLSYTMQELVFYSWFFNASPSLGAGGLYSNNGTFTGFAKVCPPGGTF